MEKDRLFQYADNYKIYEDTDLITREEANILWEKYYYKVVEDLEDGVESQMCIWKDCKHNTHYHKKEKELDHYDYKRNI